MKNAKKILALLLCAVLLVAGSVAGTIAYLTDSTKTLENTFTVGNVDISLKETLVDEYGVAYTGDKAGTTDKGNNYKLIPGHEYTKDPTVTVEEGSEDCFIFVKIENGLGTDATLTMSTGWANVSGDVWVYGTTAEPVAVSAGTAVVPFTKFTFGAQANPAAHANSTIKVTAYAIQADGLDAKTAAELWTNFSA